MFNRLFDYLYMMLTKWRMRPTRNRDWHVICMWGGGNFPLDKTKEKNIHKALAPQFSVVYIDRAHGLIFVNDGSGPKAK